MMNQSNLARLLGLSTLEANGAGENIIRLFDDLRPARAPGGACDGRPHWSVPPLAEMAALNELAELREAAPGLSERPLRLSNFAYLRPFAGALVLESPLSQFRVTLTDPRAGKLLLELVEPGSIAARGRAADLSTELCDAFLQLLWRGGFLAVDSESNELRK